MVCDVLLVLSLAITWLWLDHGPYTVSVRLHAAGPCFVSTTVYLITSITSADESGQLEIGQNLKVRT